jgi:hypothetical protein
MTTIKPMPAPFPWRKWAIPAVLVAVLGAVVWWGLG